MAGQPACLRLFRLTVPIQFPSFWKLLKKMLELPFSLLFGAFLFKPKQFWHVCLKSVTIVKMLFLCLASLRKSWLRFCNAHAVFSARDWTALYWPKLLQDTTGNCIGNVWQVTILTSISHIKILGTSALFTCLAHFLFLRETERNEEDQKLWPKFQYTISFHRKQSFQLWFKWFFERSNYL